MQGTIIIKEEIFPGGICVYVLSFGHLGHYVFTEMTTRNFNIGDIFEYTQNQWWVNTIKPIILKDFHLITRKRVNRIIKELKKTAQKKYISL